MESSCSVRTDMTKLIVFFFRNFADAPKKPGMRTHKMATYNEDCIRRYKGKGKGKAVPLQVWSGPEGSRKLRFPDFMTTQDGGKFVSLTHRPPLPPGNKYTWYSFLLEAESNPGP
jgi:hypothetical protein